MFDTETPGQVNLPIGSSILSLRRAGFNEANQELHVQKIITHP
jgi:hypothetical protein